MNILTGPAEDYPSHMARRLAGYGYRPDTIHAALMNSFGRSVDPRTLHDLTRKAEKRREPKPRYHCTNLTKRDQQYRDEMEAANARFVARLALAGAEI